RLTSSAGAGQVEARCGWLTVYEDRAAGRGRQIRLHVAVIPAVSRSPAPDPLFFIPGGPGEAASEAYLGLADAFTRLNQKRDIVLVDQRGTGRSHPLDCGDDDTEDVSANDPADLQAAFQRCLQAQDADPRFYTTAIAMDDLDQVRQALGYQQINLYGASYGTRAALVYMRQHPGRVRSAILDGVAPVGWPLGVDAPQDAQRALEMLFERCAAQPECAKAFPDLPRKFDALLERLDEQAPIETALDHPISGLPTSTPVDRARFTNLVHLMSYAPETAALLPLLIHDAYQRQSFDRFAAISLSTEGTLSSAISVGMRMSVTCAEDLPLYQQARVTEGYLGDYSVATFKDICQVWPQGAIPDGYNQPVHSDAPVLLISGEADPVTPPENAAQAAETLPNSLQLVAPGMGHVNINRGCISRLAARFIEAGSPAGLDPACVANIAPLPFFVNFSGPTP
ncbi:MAG: alpha/beta hydrolase, partial [Chloroflexota bacterium]